jgi:hypothetical protein
MKARTDMEKISIQNDTGPSVLPALPQDAGAQPPQAWEMIENGRYQPRRIKGSCLGRELG